MARRSFQLGTAGVVGLVLLRVTVGWHFMYSGLWKLESPTFSSSGFLSQAKGPLAEHFYAMLPDIDGLQHLDSEGNQQAMRDYADRFAKAHALGEERLDAVQRFLKLRQESVAEYLAERKEAIADYQHDLARLEEAKRQPGRDMPFQQKRIWDAQTQLRAKAAGWSAGVDGIWNDLQADLENLVRDQPRRDVPLRPVTELAEIDRVVIYTNIAIGGCLIVGLFTRLAAFGGALFLLQIVAAQPDWPGLYPPPHPSAGRSLIVNKEFVEMMALVAIGLTPVGRWCGLDHFVHHLVVRPLFGKKGTV